MVLEASLATQTTRPSPPPTRGPSGTLHRPAVGTNGAIDAASSVVDELRVEGRCRGRRARG